MSLCAQDQAEPSEQNKLSAAVEGRRNLVTFFSVRAHSCLVFLMHPVPHKQTLLWVPRSRNRLLLSGSGWDVCVHVCERERERERCQCLAVPCSWLRLLSRLCRTSPAPWDPNLWALLIKNHGLGSWDAGGGHNRLSTECSKGGVGMKHQLIYH